MADDLAFDEFYRTTSPRMLRYAYGMVGELGTAQDITQEAYVRAWRRWSTISSYDHPESWVRLAVTRLATDWWRRLVVRRRYERTARPPEAVPPPSETSVVLVSALRRLPAAQRRVICLHYLLDRSVADIAAETGVPEGTVKSWLSRGRALLAAALEDRTASLQEGSGG